MQADEAPGVLQSGSDGRDGEGGSVGREQTVVGDDLLQRPEQLLLHRELFHDSLDDERGVGELGELRGRLQTGPGGVPFHRCHPAFFDQPVEARADGVRGLVHASGDGVVEAHRMARDKGDLGDSLPHGAGADHGDGPALLDGGHGSDPPR